MTTHCTYITKDNANCSDKGVYMLHNVRPKEIVTTPKHNLATFDNGRNTGTSLCEHHYNLLLKAHPFRKYPTNRNGTYCSHTKDNNHCKNPALKAWFIQHRDRHTPVFAGIAHCETHSTELLTALFKREKRTHRLPPIEWNRDEERFYIDLNNCPGFILPSNI